MLQTYLCQYTESVSIIVASRDLNSSFQTVATEIFSFRDIAVVWLPWPQSVRKGLNVLIQAVDCAKKDLCSAQVHALFESLLEWK